MSAAEKLEADRSIILEAIAQLLALLKTAETLDEVVTIGRAVEDLEDVFDRNLSVQRRPPKRAT